MKKALIDQMMLGLFIFVTLIVLGATVADNTQARDTYYNLQKITDNSARAMGLYYLDAIEDGTEKTVAIQESEAISNAILDKTKLGIEAKKLIAYKWDFVADPPTVSATVKDYKHGNFWYRFLDLASFDLKAFSLAEIDEGGPIKESSDLTPFGINGCNRDSLDPSDSNALTPGSIHTFSLRGNSNYENEDYSKFYGIDIDDACFDDGNSNWAHFKLAIKNFYVEDETLKNDEPLLDITIDDTQICVPKVKKIAMEENTDPQQISQSLAGLENKYPLTGVETDIVLFGCNEDDPDNLIIEQLVKVKFVSNPSESYVGVKNDYDILEFKFEIISLTTPPDAILIPTPHNYK